jgi:hypothetical protein
MKKSKSRKIVDQIIKTLDTMDELDIDKILLQVYALSDESVAEEFMNRFRKKSESEA